MAVFSGPHREHNHRNIPSIGIGPYRSQETESAQARPVADPIAAFARHPALPRHRRRLRRVREDGAAHGDSGVGFRRRSYCGGTLTSTLKAPP